MGEQNFEVHKHPPPSSPFVFNQFAIDVVRPRNSDPKFLHYMANRLRIRFHY